jgi:hypothetical protein
VSPAEHELRLRQQRLLGRSEQLRARIAVEAQVLRGPLAGADQALAAWRWLRGHPEVPLALVAVAVVVRPARAWRWLRRGWWTWRAWRRLQRVWAARP